MKYIVKVFIKEWNCEYIKTVYEGSNLEIVKSYIKGYSSAGKYVTVEECE